MHSLSTSYEYTGIVINLKTKGYCKVIFYLDVLNLHNARLLWYEIVIQKIELKKVYLMESCDK